MCRVWCLLTILMNIWGFTPVAEAQTLIFGRDKTMREEFPQSSLLLEQAYEKLGIALDFQEATARRALLESENGNWDGEVLRIGSITEQAPNLRRVPVVLATLQIALFQRDDLAEILPTQLQGKRLAVPAGYRIAEQLSKQYGFELMETSDLAAALKMVELGRADCTLHSLQIGQQRIEMLKLQHVISYGHILAQIPLYHFLHRKHEDLIPQITPILEALIKQAP